MTDPTADEVVALKACPDPWCPTNETGAPEFGEEPVCVYQEYGGYAVQCAVCELAGPHKRTAADAIAAWNTRPAADAGEVRPYPDLLSDEEQKALLTRAEELWADLQANNLGGFSGINRPFWILFEFKRVIEAFGRRDVGLSWSKDDLDSTLPDPAQAVGEG